MKYTTRADWVVKRVEINVECTFVFSTNLQIIRMKNVDIYLQAAH